MPALAFLFFVPQQCRRRGEGVGDGGKRRGKAGGYINSERRSENCQLTSWAYRQTTLLTRSRTKSWTDRVVDRLTWTDNLVYRQARGKARDKVVNKVQDRQDRELTVMDRRGSWTNKVVVRQAGAPRCPCRRRVPLREKEVRVLIGVQTVIYRLASCHQ